MSKSKLLLLITHHSLLLLEKDEAPATLGQESIRRRGLPAPRYGRGFHWRGALMASQWGERPKLVNKELFGANQSRL